MLELSGDPYAGARRAFFVLNQNLTDGDWEAWLISKREGANGEFDNFKALSWLCREAAQAEMEAEVRVLVAYASGFFEAMQRVVDSVLATMPVSEYVPHHFPRYRRTLINAATQFTD